MSKRKYNEINNIPIDIIFKLENAVDIYLLKKSENFKCNLRKKIKELPKEILDDINNVNEIINNKKKEHVDNTFNSFDFSIYKDLSYSSKDILLD
tara:strand:+ start:41 stop:325 length:285 start_codon:yes stop_codon:yes gene_type:complete